MTKNEPTPAEQVEQLRHLTQDCGMSNLDALALVRAAERGRRLGQRINPHGGTVAPKQEGS
jgi:hypothetical protein